MCAGALSARHSAASLPPAPRSKATSTRRCALHAPTPRLPPPEPAQHLPGQRYDRSRPPPQRGNSRERWHRRSRTGTWSASKRIKHRRVAHGSTPRGALRSASKKREGSAAHALSTSAQGHPSEPVAAAEATRRHCSCGHKSTAARPCTRTCTSALTLAWHRPRKHLCSQHIVASAGHAFSAAC